MSIAATPVHPSDHPRRRFTGALAVLAQRREYGLLVLVAAIVLFTGLANPAFFSPGNVQDTLVSFVPEAIVSCGMLLVIATGEIDISVGGLMSLLAAMLGLLASPTHANMPVWLVIMLTLLAGIAVGFLNGILVAVAGIPSIIVTLGMYTALPAVTNMLMHGQYVTDVPPALRFWGSGTFLTIPISLWTTAVVALCAMFLAWRTALGRRIFAVGSNPHAARLAGVSIVWTKIFVFTLSGFLVGIATLVTATQLSVIEPGTGQSLALAVVTCVVVGGASISGGRGTIPGALLGVCLLGLVRGVLIFLKLGQHAIYWEHAIQGALILAAVLVDHLASRRLGGEGHA